MRVIVDMEARLRYYDAFTGAMGGNPPTPNAAAGMIAAAVDVAITGLAHMNGLEVAGHKADLDELLQCTITAINEGVRALRPPAAPPGPTLRLVP